MRPDPDRRGRLALALAAGLAPCACTSDDWPPPQDVDDESSGGEPADDLRLEVFEPRSPSIHYIGEMVPLLAELREDGEIVVGFDAIAWTTDVPGPTLHVGPDAEVVLAPGYYDVTATATLPGGDRLATTVGGVRVQSRWTGLYTGEVSMLIALDFMGFPVQQSCVAPIDLRVDYDGEAVEFATGGCTLTTLLGPFDAAVAMTGTFANGTGTGQITYDIGGLYSFEFAWTGAFVEDGFLGGFGGPVSLPFIGSADVTGSFDAPLSTPYLEPS